MSAVKDECLSHQVGHDDGSVSALPRHWVTPLSAFKDLKESQVIGKPFGY